MEFLKACAQRLDDGEAAASVLDDLRARYTTVRCLNVKMSLIRRMCRPTEDFARRANGNVALLSGKERAPPDFPPRLPPNVLAFRLPRDEMRACKKLHVASAVSKNRKMRRVDGRLVLHACRAEVDAVVAGQRAPGPTLVLALMLLTGRRTCELVNGRSSFEERGEYAIEFVGQAKKRHAAHGYVVPCLHPAKAVVEAMDRLRGWVVPPPTRDGVTLNQASSQKYQSWLRRTLLAHDALSCVGKVHGLRGVYARMTYRLFDWEGDYTEAYVVMNILGHADLTESLVYTAFHIGDQFHEEPRLGTFQSSWEDRTEAC